MIAITTKLEMTINDFLDTVYKPARLADAARGSVVQYEVSINAFRKWAAREPVLSDLSEELLTHWLAEKRQRGWAAATCNGHLRRLLTLWRYAKLRSYPLPEGDLNLIQKFRESQSQPTAWTDEEMARIIESARLARGRIAGIRAEAWWVALILTLYNTGLRRKAAFGCRVDELDFSRHILRVPAERMKNRVEQFFLLKPETMAAIEETFPPRRELLFPFPFTHHLAIYDRLRAILRRAGLPTTRRDLFHKFRRTTASHLARVAGEAMAIQQLGHRDQSTIKRYVDPTFTNSHKAALLLGSPGFLAAEVTMLPRPASECLTNHASAPTAPAAGEVPCAFETYTIVVGNSGQGVPAAVEAPVAVEPTAPPRLTAVAMGAGRPPADADLIDALRVKRLLTWSDVRKVIRTLLIPPSMFALELKTPPGPLAVLLKSRRPLTPLWDQRVRLTLGLNHPPGRGRGIKRERATNY